MKMLRVILLFVIIVLFGCKKSNPEPTLPAPAIITLDTMQLINAGHQSSSEWDSIVVTVNGSEKLRLNSIEITDLHLVPCKTGDIITVRYNPGQTYYPHFDGTKWVDYITSQNGLLISFAYKRPEQKYSCRCITNYTVQI